MTRQSISLTEPNDRFLNSLVSSGEFASKSEAVNYLIRENRISEMSAIRTLLQEGIDSGLSDKSVDQIWDEAKKRHKAKRG